MLHLLCHNFLDIEYGKKIFEKLKSEISDKDFYYIDGEVSGKNREIIKAEMDKTKENVEYTILNFGDYEVEVESNFKILLTNGKYKLAKDIDSDDDINDDFIKKLK